MRHLPREHGGTVMVLFGALAGWLSEPRFSLAPMAMFIAVSAAFFLRDPLGLLLKRPAASKAARQEMLRASVLWTTLGLVSTAALFLELPLEGLLLLAGLGAPSFFLLVFARATRRERRPWAEAVGVASLLLPPMALRLATHGTLDRDAWVLGGACLLFFAGATLHLRSLVRTRKAPGAGRTWAWLVSPAAAGLAFLLFASGIVPWAVAAANSVAFVRPLVMRGWVLKNPRRLGFTETALAAAFLGILTLFRG